MGQYPHNKLFTRPKNSQKVRVVVHLQIIQALVVGIKHQQLWGMDRKFYLQQAAIKISYKIHNQHRQLFMGN